MNTTLEQQMAAVAAVISFLTDKDLITVNAEAWHALNDAYSTIAAVKAVEHLEPKVDMDKVHEQTWAEKYNVLLNRFERLANDFQEQRNISRQRMDEIIELKSLEPKEKELKDEPFKIWNDKPAGNLS